MALSARPRAPMAARRPPAFAAPAAALLAALLLVAAAGPAAAGDSGDWIVGRATFYDDNQHGSCHYGTHIPEHYAAWPDTLEGFAGSCGTCLEVACVNADFGDNYGGWMQRSGACYDEAATVTVKIVDSCPCVHANAYSNRRWCCGDMKHIDLGRAAFKRLADEKWGVIGLKWRRVSCDKLGSAGTTSPGAGGGSKTYPQQPQQAAYQQPYQQQQQPYQQQGQQQQQQQGGSAAMGALQQHLSQGQGKGQRQQLPSELASAPSRSWGHGGDDGGEWQRYAAAARGYLGRFARGW